MRTVILSALLLVCCVVLNSTATTPTITQGVNYVYEEYFQTPKDTLRGVDTLVIFPNFNSNLAGDLILHCSGFTKADVTGTVTAYRGCLQTVTLDKDGVAIQSTATTVDTLLSTPVSAYIPRTGNNMKIFVVNKVANDSAIYPKLDIEFRKAVTITKAR